MVLRSISGRFVSGCVFTTEGTERSGRNGMSPPNRPKNATDYTPFSPLAIRCVSLRLHLPMAKKPKSAAPRLKELRTELVSLLPCRGADFNTESQRHGGTEEENRCVKHDDLSVPLCLCASVLRKQVRKRFCSHSFVRSVADLGFSPDGNWIRREAQERRVGEKPYNRPRIPFGGANRRTHSAFSVPFRFFRSKKRTRDDLTTKSSKEC